MPREADGLPGRLRADAAFEIYFRPINQVT